MMGEGYFAPRFPDYKMISGCVNISPFISAPFIYTAADTALGPGWGEGEAGPCIL